MPWLVGDGTTQVAPLPQAPPGSTKWVAPLPLAPPVLVVLLGVDKVSGTIATSASSCDVKKWVAQLLLAPPAASQEWGAGPKQLLFPAQARIKIDVLMKGVRSGHPSFGSYMERNYLY
ncbi:hypothetical protein E2542_SST22981 [Spatholobus suberectus]|nr:hypothetical protein E2542_SST22981 [Spatholobus suberectus]